MATVGTLVEEVGAPVLLVVRLKVVDQKITEMELVATRSRADGLIFNIDGLSAASEAMNYAPRPEQLATRDEVLKASLKYPRRLSNAKTFADVNAPFTADAYRYENGQIMAAAGLQVRAGLPEHLHATAHHFQPPRQGRRRDRWRRRATRHWIVASELGRARADRAISSRPLKRSKVYDGKIHAVEAFIRIFPVELAKGGW